MHIFLFNNSIFSFVVPVPRRLRFKVLSAGKLLVSWKEPKGEYDGYKFIYNTEPGKKQCGQSILYIYEYSGTMFAQLLNPVLTKYSFCFSSFEPQFFL